MVRCRSLIVNSRTVALESTNPRFCDGIDWENRRKDSDVVGILASEGK